MLSLRWRADTVPGSRFEGLEEDLGEPPTMNPIQCDAVLKDGALWKHGSLGQGIYVDPARHFVRVHHSTHGYVPSYGEDEMPGYPRRAAEHPAGG